MPDDSREHVGRRDRAVSEVIGYVLVFSLIFATIGLVSVGGLPALDSAREHEQLQNAERAFDVLDTNLAEVYERGAPSRTTELRAEDGLVETRDAVTFNVTAEAADGNVTALETEISPIVFSGLGETEFVYEGGAVVRSHPDHDVMLRDPPFTRGNDRVLVTLVQTFSDSSRAVGGRTVLIRASSARRSVEIPSTATDDAQYEQLNVTIAGSPREDVWRRYFETELDFDCTTGGGLDCGTDLTGGEQPFVTIQGIEIELEI